MAKKAAYGSKLAVQFAQAGLYINIAFVGDFSGPDVNIETIDVTTHDSPDHFNEFLAGMADGGEVPFDLVFDPSLPSHADLYNAVADRFTHNFQVQLPGFVDEASGGFFQFAGIFTKFGTSSPVKDKLMASCSIKVSGKPVFTAFV